MAGGKDPARGNRIRALIGKIDETLWQAFSVIAETEGLRPSALIYNVIKAYVLGATERRADTRPMQGGLAGVARLIGELRGADEKVTLTALQKEMQDLIGTVSRLTAQVSGLRREVAARALSDSTDAQSKSPQSKQGS